MVSPKLWIEWADYSPWPAFMPQDDSSLAFDDSSLALDDSSYPDLAPAADWTTPAPVLENGRSDQGGPS